jgi:hypothetical protein
MSTINVCTSDCETEMLKVADKVWNRVLDDKADKDDAAALATVVRACLRDDCE